MIKSSGIFCASMLHQRCSIEIPSTFRLNAAGVLPKTPHKLTKNQNIFEKKCKIFIKKFVSIEKLCIFATELIK